MFIAFAPWKNSKKRLSTILLVCIFIYFMGMSLWMPIGASDEDDDYDDDANPLDDANSTIPMTKLSVHIFFKDNLAKLEHLWASINAANQISTPVSFQIHAKPLKNNEVLTSYLNGLNSSHGDIELIEVLEDGKTIRESMMAAWTPKTKTEFAIFLDHNTIVSPHFLEYAEQMVANYYLRLDALGMITNSNTTLNIVGVSLHNSQYDQVHEKAWDVPVHPPTPYLHQFPQTHGVILAPIPWTRFRSWYYSLPPNTNSLLPNSMTNRWNPEDGCKKDLARFMYLSGMTMIYPNYPKGLSLVSRQGRVPGSISSLRDLGVPLLNLTDSKNSVLALTDTDNRLKLSGTLKRLKKLAVFDTYFEKKDNVHQLKQLSTNPDSFNKCTLIMNVYDRVGSLIDRVRHYENYSKLDRIIIVWNHQRLRPKFAVSQDLRNASIPLDLAATRKDRIQEFLIPVHILQQDNSSLNNRYLPFPEIQTDCIISMDDDFDYPFYQLDYSVSLFQGHFFNHAIGFKHMGRSHKRGVKIGTYDYITESDKGVSMVLPTGMVFHRKYLAMYSYDLPQHARDIVDSKTNGEDILFNMMVAKHTKSCPVVVNMFSRGVQMNNGLWKKPTHFQDRSRCLTRLVKEVYQTKNPLRFSTKFFRGVGKDGMTPSISDLKCVDQVNY
ncbi:UNVERIFIED_CONTAM: Exostoses (Multiple)-like 3 [Siphonaria sp. JEL0065]|nr:Exostoses (Multiple)-like 3 [Siphonaria sp. JEL0065]